MERIGIKKGEYCLSEEALGLIHGTLYKYYVSNKKPTFYNGGCIVDIPNINDWMVLIRADGNEYNLNKNYIYSKIDLGYEYCTLKINITPFSGFITNQYGRDDLHNKSVIAAIKVLGCRAGSNGCIFEIIDDQYSESYEYYKRLEDEKTEREREQRKIFLVKNCESDRSYIRELRRNYGIEIHG